MPRLNTPTVTPTRDARIGQMRQRALLATIERDRADLLTQLVNHLGPKNTALTLADLSTNQLVKALKMLEADKRAAVYRELSQTQRDLWHAAHKRSAGHPLTAALARLTSWLRPARFEATRP